MEEPEGGRGPIIVMRLYTVASSDNDNNNDNNNNNNNNHDRT